MSIYCTRSNIEAVFGVTNISNWADLDNDQDADNITARITRAIVVVGAEIDDIFRVTGYRIPIADSDGDTPTTIENLAATKAGLWLYEARGVNDMDNSGQPMHRLRYMQIWVRRVLEEYRNQKRELDAVQ